ncbi:transglutaminase-like domain-containing protein [Ferrimonas marina]|uniref:Tetratricopeptide repeat-containing protein n=1 Tax=Ferrimonas marina TaxID=299255 RepID=A0A1M5X1I6_9GAMM|nr:transglutaminase family protein [Ferrimonas marina]SHH93053.1 Tetratricopeptide repeat-containing protein [Ferrimonas marina]
MRTLSVFLALLLGLAGCASSGPTQTADPSLWQDHHFDDSGVVPSPEQAFAMSPPMEVLARKLAKSSNPKKALVDYLFDDGEVRYDNSRTRNASETFETGSGNCMSLVLMTASLARSLNIPYQYQLVEAPPVWDRQGGLYLLNGHVNLRLSNVVNLDEVRFSGDTSTIDFLPGSQMRGYQIRRLSESQLMARYYNNLAAEAMVDGDRDRAYQLLKMAYQIEPGYDQMWNTLGVLYRRHGLEAEAEAVYRHAMQLPKVELDAMHNLSVLLASQNRLIEWQAIHKELELRRIRNPYYYYDMGEQAYRRGQYASAVRYFERALDLADYRHEFHFGLSRAYFSNGQFRLSERHLSKAHELAPQNEKQRYQLKLTALRSH